MTEEAPSKINAIPVDMGSLDPLSNTFFDEPPKIAPRSRFKITRERRVSYSAPGGSLSTPRLPELEPILPEEVLSSIPKKYGRFTVSLEHREVPTPEKEPKFTLEVTTKLDTGGSFGSLIAPITAQWTRVNFFTQIIAVFWETFLWDDSKESPTALQRSQHIPQV